MRSLKCLLILITMPWITAQEKPNTALPEDFEKDVYIFYDASGSVDAGAYFNAIQALSDQNYNLITGHDNVKLIPFSSKAFINRTHNLNTISPKLQEIMEEEIETAQSTTLRSTDLNQTLHDISQHKYSKTKPSLVFIFSDFYNQPTGKSGCDSSVIRSAFNGFRVNSTQFNPVSAKQTESPVFIIPVLFPKKNIHSKEEACISKFLSEFEYVFDYINSKPPIATELSTSTYYGNIISNIFPYFTKPLKFDYYSINYLANSIGGNISIQDSIVFVTLENKNTAPFRLTYNLQSELPSTIIAKPNQPVTLPINRNLLNTLITETTEFLYTIDNFDQTHALTHTTKLEPIKISENDKFLLSISNIIKLPGQKISIGLALGGKKNTQIDSEESPSFYAALLPLSPTKDNVKITPVTISKLATSSRFQKIDVPFFKSNHIARIDKSNLDPSDYLLVIQKELSNTTSTNIKSVSTIFNLHTIKNSTKFNFIFNLCWFAFFLISFRFLYFIYKTFSSRDKSSQNLFHALIKNSSPLEIINTLFTVPIPPFTLLMNHFEASIPPFSSNNWLLLIIAFVLYGAYLIASWLFSFLFNNAKKIAINSAKDSDFTFKQEIIRKTKHYTIAYLGFLFCFAFIGMLLVGRMI